MLLRVRACWLKAAYRFIASILVVILLAQAAWAELPDGIEVSLNASQTEFGINEKILLEVSYTNVTQRNIKLLIWGTALEGRINEDFLSIVHDGKELPYMGLHIKRAPATPSDFVTIAPNQTLSRKVDLLQGYDIDYKGAYQITPRDQAHGSSRKVAAVSVTLLADRPVSFKRTPSVSDCPDNVTGLPNNRFALIDSAVSSAESIARKARDDMSNTPLNLRTDARRYREWFGSYGQARWDSVQVRLNNIYNAARSQTLVFNCEDNENYFAAVFPSQPYRIFLGRAFWSAPRVGTDSKAGTIVHELSHFNVLGINGSGTDDFVYGQSRARSLAMSNPNQAVANADNIEYFAENTPFLSMPKPSPDLVVNSISLSLVSARIGQSVSVSGLVENLGAVTSAATQLSFKVSNDAQITVDDPQIQQDQLAALSAGSSANFATEVFLPSEAGQYWLGVCISPVAGEVATANNCSSAEPILVKRRALIPSILFLLLSGDD